MIRRPPRSTRTDTLFPYTTLFRSVHIIDALPTHAVKQVENNPGTHVLSVRGTRSSYIALNNQKPPFDDVRVRHAVAHALARQLIVDKILDGNATLIDGILSPDAFGKNTGLPTYAVDPEKAKAMPRSEERRVGKECVSTGGSRGWP